MFHHIKPIVNLPIPANSKNAFLEERTIYVLILLNNKRKI